MHWPASIAMQSKPDKGIALLLLALAAALGAGVGFGTSINPALPLAILFGIVAVILLVLRPRWAFALFIFALLVIEEFPSVQGETVERSTRTAFYAKSLGLGGLYAPDLWIIALLGIFLFLRLANHRRLGIVVDQIGWALMLIAFMATLSIVLSFTDGDPFAGGIIQETTGVAININEQALKMIALFHFKLFFMMFAAYLLTQLIIETRAHLQDLLRVCFVGALACVAVGAARIALNPGLIRQGLPLFYDSPSSWFFALFAMYTVVAWAHHLSPPRRIQMMTAISAVLMIFVLVSFRRTMWGAILLASIPLFFWLPSRARGRLVMILGVGFSLLLLIVLATPLRDVILAPVLGRVEQTNVSDVSTLYRLAIAVHIVDNFDTIPLFGHGARPLWNEIAALGFFRTNLENIHSLYWWWLLRTGLIGVLVGAIAIGMIFRQTWKSARTPASPQLRAIGIMIFLAFLMFLFSGIFNPVYAQVRYMVPVGIGLAIATRILQLAREERQGALAASRRHEAA